MAQQANENLMVDLEQDKYFKANILRIALECQNGSCYEWVAEKIMINL